MVPNVNNSSIPENLGLIENKLDLLFGCDLMHNANPALLVVERVAAIFLIKKRKEVK